MDTPQQMLLFGDLVPIGGGAYKIVPARPLGAELSPKLAARFLGVSRPTMYRLIDQGIIPCRRPSPGKILIEVEALKKHKAASADPEFWDGKGNLSRRVAESAAAKLPKPTGLCL